VLDPILPYYSGFSRLQTVKIDKKLQYIKTQIVPKSTRNDYNRLLIYPGRGSRQHLEAKVKQKVALIHAHMHPHKHTCKHTRMQMREHAQCRIAQSQAHAQTNT